MALTNAYCTLDEVKLALGATSTANDLRLELAINSASRQIDKFCDRRFWQDSTVKVREYYSDSATCCYVDDISTETGLIVQVDDNDDGTYATTLTINTNFRLMPLNAADEVPVMPYTEIVIVDDVANYFPVSQRRPGVKVTAKFGWPAVPDDVRMACIIQSAYVFKSTDAVFGGIQLGVEGAVIRLRSGLHTTAADLLEGYVKRA